jgi:lysophospholipase L1-like esterase
VATAGALGALEAGSYLAGRFEVAPAPMIDRIEPKREENFVYDPLLFWRLRPNTRMGPTRTNSQGLRSEEIPAHPADEFRVLSLGESSTIAGRLEYDATYSALVERMIGRVGDRRLRVINAGVPGYSLFQGWAYLAHRGLDLEPDAVLLYFGYNDFLPVAYSRQRDPLVRRDAPGYDDWSLYERRRAWPSRLSAWLAERSNAVRGLRALLRRRVRWADVVRATDAGPRVPAEHRELLLSRIHRLCREHDVQLAIVVPWYREFEDHVPLLREVAERLGITLVDLPERLRDLPEPRAAYFMDDVHPNEEGHRRIAEAIVEVVAPRWR